MTKRIKSILTILENPDNGLEIVSYGLAPNPDGFCYERDDNANRKAEARLIDLLNGLTSKEIKELRGILF